MLTFVWLVALWIVSIALLGAGLLVLRRKGQVGTARALFILGGVAATVGLVTLVLTLIQLAR
jgi:hypothetical protein